MKIRAFQRRDLRTVVRVKRNVFLAFNSADYFKKEAVAEYVQSTNPSLSDEVLITSFLVTPETIFYVAEYNGKVIGYIKGKKSRIGNLFVVGAKHRQGVGKRLVEAFEREAKKRGSRTISISSSIYATPFYQRMGYKKTTGVRNLHGLKTQPMRKNLG